jgi:hypothetical protein
MRDVDLQVRPLSQKTGRKGTLRPEERTIEARKGAVLAMQLFKGIDQDMLGMACVNIDRSGSILAIMTLQGSYPICLEQAKFR